MELALQPIRQVLLKWFFNRKCCRRFWGLFLSFYGLFFGVCAEFLVRSIQNVFLGLLEGAERLLGLLALRPVRSLALGARINTIQRLQILLQQFLVWKLLTANLR